MGTLDWDDLRFVAAVAETGSLLAAGRRLQVDHTTVGRRVDAAEQALGVRLFTRARSGYALTEDGERLMAPIRRVEAAVLAVERDARAHEDGLCGTIRLTSPETFGVHYLAPRLAAFMREHLGVVIELHPAGAVLDLSRGEAEIAIRGFQSDREGLVVRRVAEVRYGLYGAKTYLDGHPVSGPGDLSAHPILSVPPASDDLEAVWLRRLNPEARPCFVSELSSALWEAARAGAGLAILPRYLGDGDPELRHVPMPDPPSQSMWMTVHRDLRQTPRVRALLDALAATMKADASVFRGDP